MKYQDIVKFHLKEHINVLDEVKNTCLFDLIKISLEIAQRLYSGSTLFICGNGGSASDSQHLSAELIGRFKKNRKALKSISLNSDTSVLTCISNDFSFDEVFSRQIEGLGKENDILFVFSTSGESKNIIKALNTAKKLKMYTTALLGKGGGKAIKLSQKSILVPSSSTARIQEMHILMVHLMCEIIEEELHLNK
tara:strand:- start:844 stop:1425 length:582 start_codon:yes stop_codon:yes gene_type:complete